jgi:hypothetical protein
VDYDRLAVTNNYTGLSNANLTIIVSTNLNPSASVIQTQVFDIVTCANDLTGLSFSSVTWTNDWSGTVEYSNRFIRLSNLRLYSPGTMFIIR